MAFYKRVFRNLRAKHHKMYLNLMHKPSLFQIPITIFWIKIRMISHLDWSEMPKTGFSIHVELVITWGRLKPNVKHTSQNICKFQFIITIVFYQNPPNISSTLVLNHNVVRIRCNSRQDIKYTFYIKWKNAALKFFTFSNILLLSAGSKLVK